MSDELDDDRTRLIREPAVDNDATTISRAPAVDDEATTISRGPVVDFEDRTVLRSDRDALAGFDDRTTVSPGRADNLDDATKIRGTARPGVDYDTKVTGDRTHRGPKASAPAPGRLSGGRVAFVPGEKVERYQVRETSPVIDTVVRTVIPAPVPPTRQSRNTVAIETSVTRKTKSRGVGVIIAIVAVTVVTIAIVAGVVIVLFVL